MALIALTNSLTTSQAAAATFKLSLGSDQVKLSLASTYSPVHRSLISSLSFGGRISTQKLCRSFRKQAKKNMLNTLVSQFWGIDNRFNLLIRNSIRNTASIHSSSPIVVARLFGPAIFEASKLRVFFLGIEDDKHPREQQRTYTLTHSDISAKLTLAISREINKAQIMGWYSRLQRDEVLAEWKKVQGHMSLHVHCHISGGHWLHNLIAKLRFYIFRKELPVVCAIYFLFRKIYTS
ncbi:hypothetical protein O6H91_Y252800 [Diphasiastrum complanatum]|nr:hypothetical protein O6H91_Y515300 [Diphasiastrum complanatum]KAJ7294358.1 hypothetical protein O6H91_Y263300 [Diphasiastrum complanatum]KAJ7294509.1 hypothetical protein O6H91_Y252800 [Diphasiastrum complanatum]